MQFVFLNVSVKSGSDLLSRNSVRDVSHLNDVKLPTSIIFEFKIMSH